MRCKGDTKRIQDRLQRQIARLTSNRADLLAALKLVMLTGDEDGNALYCCCPRKGAKGFHATGCAEARALLSRLEKGERL